MKIISQFIIVILTSLSISGCFAPAIVMENNGCHLVTKKLKLALSKEQSSLLIAQSISSLETCYGPECLIIYPLAILAISASSIIVSGSIVIAGNTIHWVEKQGSCQDSVTQRAVNNLVNSTIAIGGQTVESTNKLINWFKQLVN
ncbi:MAG: hypothetical protein KAH84_09100 [Thiomargarita sp.]|nr:hypothetical protein [Thiomargarita sp.]